ncbi:MAG: GAF domain-containing protein [Flexilinea sp.]
MKSEYQILQQQMMSLLAGESNLIANLANASALLKECLPDINWAGFYLLQNKELILGPFQGKPACVHISLGSGVCGTSILLKKTLLVPDVHAFTGHIACDSASNSEIVIPLYNYHKEIIGVLDIDSTLYNRFTLTDQTELEEIAQIIGNSIL